MYEKRITLIARRKYLMSIFVFIFKEKLKKQTKMIEIFPQSFLFCNIFPFVFDCAEILLYFAVWFDYNLMDLKIKMREKNLKGFLECCFFGLKFRKP